MRILVVDQCSNAKETPGGFEPLDVGTVDAHTRSELVGRNGIPALPARKLYQGRQQGYIDRATNELRETGDTVDRLFISAGFGLLDEKDRIPPYDVTFSDLTADQIEDRSARLGIHDDLIQVLRTSDYDVIFLTLGSDYYRSLDLGEVIETVGEDTTVVVFNGALDGEEKPQAVTIPARTKEAREQETIVVSLKGKYLKNFAEHRAAGKEPRSKADVEAWCVEELTSQTGFEEYSGESG
jgi:hypothetical protein